MYYIGGARTRRNVEEHETEEKETGQSSATTKNHNSNGRYVSIQLIYTFLRKYNSLQYDYNFQYSNHIVGSRSKAAWPIAPGSGSGVKPVQIELQSASSEYEEEMLKNRFEVAQVLSKCHSNSVFTLKPILIDGPMSFNENCN